MLDCKLVFANPYKVIALLMNEFRAALEVFVPIDSSLVRIVSTNVIRESSSSRIKSKDAQFNDVVLLDNLLFIVRMDTETLSKSPNKSSISSDLSVSVSDVLKMSSNDSFNIEVCMLRFLTEVSDKRIAEVIRLVESMLVSVLIWFVVMIVVGASVRVVTECSIDVIEVSVENNVLVEDSVVCVVTAVVFFVVPRDGLVEIFVTVSSAMVWKLELVFWDVCD